MRQSRHEPIRSLIFARGKIVRSLTQAVGLRAEDEQFGQSVVDEIAQSAAGALDAEPGDEGLLAGSLVLAGGLAQSFGGRGGVEQVVGELEGTAGEFGEAGEMCHR